MAPAVLVDPIAAALAIRVDLALAAVDASFAPDDVRARVRGEIETYVAEAADGGAGPARA